MDWSKLHEVELFVLLIKFCVNFD